jgi:hypothetical protein
VDLLAFLAIVGILMGSGLFVLHLFELNLRLNLFEAAASGLLIGGLFNYAIIETIGRLSLSLWAIGCAYVVLIPIVCLGFRRLHGQARPIMAGIFPFLGTAGSLFKLQAAGLAGLAIAGALQAFAPPNTYDTLNYHLFLPLYDVARGFAGPRWDHNTIFSFHPSYMAHLTRTALVFGTTSTAQLINTTFVIFAAIGTANLVFFISGIPNAAAFAALVVLSNRAVTWQLPSLEIDAVLGFPAVVSATLLLKYFHKPDRRLAVLAGIVIGCGTLIKYHGFAFAVVIGLAFLCVHVRCNRTDALRALADLTAVAAAAFAVALPHFGRNYLLIGDPLYPLFELSGMGFASMLGTGRGIQDLLAAPVLIGLVPRSYFDGMMFGAPLLLALIPLCAFVRPSSIRLTFLWLVNAFYYVIWFYFLSQQTRFLLPVLPIFAALGALGACYVAQRLDGVAKGLLVAGILGLFAAQSTFVGVYALLRIPVAVGLISKDRFFQTPSFNGTLYAECLYANERLSEHGRILALMAEGLSYCPPLKTDYSLTVAKAQNGPTSSPIDIATWIDRAKARNYEFVIVRVSRDIRNINQWSSMPTDDYGGELLDSWFRRATALLEPLADFGHVKIFSGPAFIGSLERLAVSQ